MSASSKHPDPARLEVDTEEVREEALRWQAVQVVAKLPEDIAEARRVLEMAQDLIDRWVASPPAAMARA